MRLCLILLLMVIAWPLTAQAQLQVNDIRLGQHPDKTRIVFDLNKASDFRAFTLGSPYRLVVDLPRFYWRADKANLPSGMIKALRHSAHDMSTHRIVFDLARPVNVSSAFVLPASAGKANRLVLDIVPVSAAEFVRTQGQSFGTMAADLRTAKVPERARATPQAVAPKKQTRKPVIVIDPGHGGQDPGATTGRTYEKHVALGLSKLLKRQLEARGKYKVIMTRENEFYQVA